MKTYTATDRNQLDEIAYAIRAGIESGGCTVKITKLKKSRTLSQNSALHLYLSMMSDELNDSGFTQRKLWDTMKDGFEIPVTPEMLKEVAKGVSKKMFNEPKTSLLTTIQLSALYEAINSAFGQCAGVSLPFPSHDWPPHED